MRNKYSSLASLENWLLQEKQILTYYTYLIPVSMPTVEDQSTPSRFPGTDLPSLVQKRQDLGWNSLFEGWSHRNKPWWSISLIKSLWKIAWYVWEYWNDVYPSASEEFILDLIHVSNTTNCRNCNYMQIRAFFLFLSEMLQKSVAYQDTSWLR